MTHLKQLIRKTLTTAHNNIGILVVLLVAAVIRFPGIWHGLPVYVLPSEYEIIATSIKCLKGNLYSEWISYYGGFYFYINACVIGLIHAIYHPLHLLGLFDGGSTPYWLFYVIVRGMNIMYNLVTILSVFGIVSQISNKKAGLFASLIIAILPLPHLYSLRISTDTLCTTLATLSIYFSIKHLQSKNGHKWLYLAAISSGLAIGTKLMFLSIIPFCLAKFLRDRKNGVPFFTLNLAKVLGVTVLSFFIATPFSFIYFHKFIISSLRVHELYSASYRAGADVPNIAIYFLRDLFFNAITPAVLLSSILGILFCVKKHLSSFLVIFVGPFLWSILMSTYKVAFTYNIMIITVPVAAYCGLFIDKIKSSLFKYLVLVLLCSFPTYKSLLSLKDHLKTDIRYLAQEWIGNNLPRGSRIAYEEYTPFLDNTKFSTTYIGICGSAFMSPDSIRNAGYDYLISASHSRFLRSPKKYAEEIENLRKIQSEFTVVQQFNPDNRYRGNKILVIKAK